MLRPAAAFLVAVILVASVSSAVSAGDCTEKYGASSDVYRLATGSPGELGLLKVLAETYARKSGHSMCWIKAGSGESLALLKDSKVDAIMVHAPAAERKAVEEGWAIGRDLIGSNEFFIVGPASDPAGIAKAASAADAYARIAAAKALFFSRGDNSGTHKKELSVWKAAGITPAAPWYVVTKDFMMATLKRADTEKGYFMTDSSTWVAAKKEMKNLQVLFKGDVALVNTYHGLCRPEKDTPARTAACGFLAFTVSPEGQDIIRAYGKDKYGEALYDDAAYARQYDR